MPSLYKRFKAESLLRRLPAGKKLLWSGWLAFLACLFLPSLHMLNAQTGWDALIFSLLVIRSLLAEPSTDFIPYWMAAAGLTNLALFLLPLVLLLRPTIAQRSRVVWAAALFSVLVTLSFFTMGDGLLFGYYAWVASSLFILLGVTRIRYYETSSVSSDSQRVSPSALMRQSKN